MIIGLMGNGPGAGKSTLAEVLKEEIKKQIGLECATTPFALPLKVFCIELGWDGQKDPKGRQLLNDIGMTARAYDKNVWVKKWLESTEHYRFNENSVLFVDDVRFMNEVDMIRKQGGKILYVKRDGVERPDLESEGLDLKEYDHTFDNNGSISRLRARAKEWVSINV